MSARVISRAAVAVALGLLITHPLAQHGPGARVRVDGVRLGSGTPSVNGTPPPGIADAVGENEFHVPGYLPGHPTAATLWPRVVHLPCRAGDVPGEVHCAGYPVSPLRGEYIYIKPVIEAAPAAAVEAPPARPSRPARAVSKRPLE